MCGYKVWLFQLFQHCRTLMASFILIDLLSIDGVLLILYTCHTLKENPKHRLVPLRSPQLYFTGPASLQKAVQPFTSHSEPVRSLKYCYKSWEYNKKCTSGWTMKGACGGVKRAGVRWTCPSPLSPLFKLKCDGVSCRFKEISPGVGQR